MFRKPRWSVTWPTRPSGVYTVLVRAADPTDAVRVAAELELPVNDGYSIAFDYEPQVWRLLRPYRLRSRRVAGPDFQDAVLGEVAFTPEEIDLNVVASRAMGAVKVGDALGHRMDEIRAAIGQILGGLTTEQVEDVLARVIAEVAESNAYTRGESQPEEPVAVSVGGDLPMDRDYYLGWAALSVKRMAEMERDGITPTADNRKAHQMYMDAAHRAGVTDVEIGEYARIALQGRTV